MRRNRRAFHQAKRTPSQGECLPFVNICDLGGVEYDVRRHQITVIAHPQRCSDHHIRIATTTANCSVVNSTFFLQAKSQIKSGEKKKKSTSFRMRNREKLDQNNRSRQDVQKVDGLLPNSGHTPSPTHPDVRRVSLLSSTDEVMSNEDTLSSFSYDSASLDADDVQSSSGRDSTPTSTSMDSGVMMPSCYREHDPTDALSDAGTARSRKPAKKMLKKSASMSYKSCSESATLCRLHSQTGLTIGSPFRTEEPSAEGKS